MIANIETVCPFCPSSGDDREEAIEVETSETPFPFPEDGFCFKHNLLVCTLHVIIGACGAQISWWWWKNVQDGRRCCSLMGVSRKIELWCRMDLIFPSPFPPSNIFPCIPEARWESLSKTLRQQKIRSKNLDFESYMSIYVYFPLFMFLRSFVRRPLSLEFRRRVRDWVRRREMTK